jgi:hypothetical protein
MKQLTVLCVIRALNRDLESYQMYYNSKPYKAVPLCRIKTLFYFFDTSYSYLYTYNEHFLQNFVLSILFISRWLWSNGVFPAFIIETWVNHWLAAIYRPIMLNNYIT